MAPLDQSSILALSVYYQDECVKRILFAPLIRLDRTGVEPRMNFGRERSRHLLPQAGEGTREAVNLRVAPHSPFGTLASSSASQVSACESLGARQSPRGESEPPDATFGPFGMAERLNWLVWKKR